jgi:1-deoxy-D-xylulose-5-phosphate synthase
VPGHDLPALEQTLARARELGGPVVVHVVTRKGSGYPPAEEDAEDCLHSPPPFDPPTGQPLRRTGAKWTAAFSAELRELATGRPDLVVITAAMPGPTGTAAAMADRPDHFFDVGLAEQHAVTSAAGLAMGGMHPVVAVYSTFLNRAFDQVLLDVGLHRLPVTFVADRAGITGPDGPSHHGIWDMAVFGIVPGMRIAAPRDAATLRDELREALQISTGPTLVRFPTGELPASLPALRGTGGTDLLYRSLPDDVLVVAVGPFAHIAVEAAGLLTERGYGVTVVDPRWPVPVPDEVVRMAPDFRMVLVVEDGVRTGGVGDAVARALRDAGVPTPVQSMGVSNEWHPQAPRAEILRRLGLTGDGLARRVTECLGSPRRSDPGT